MQYSYILHTPEKNLTLAEAVDVLCAPAQASYVAQDFLCRVTAQEKNAYRIIEMTVSAKTDAEVYLSIQGKGEGDIYSFAGLPKDERLYRQSPHNPDHYHFKMERSAVPMVAVVTGDAADFFISDNPSYFENATTQHILPAEKTFYLSSGDKGGQPNNHESDPFGPIFHAIGGEKTHTFRFIVFRAKANNLKNIRKEAFRAIEQVWGNGENSLYRSVCFASNYMHLRKNETGISDKWVVAGIEYANTQYFRDSFYQTMIFDDETQAQCFLALNGKEISTEAENPMVYLIWTYRIFKSGKPIFRDKADMAFREVIRCMDKKPDGGMYPNCRIEEHGAFRNWFDICCYALDDVDAYTQGLCICALEAAKRLGYDIGDRKEKALARYHSLFNGEFIPLSEQKQYLAVDISVGEVLYYMLFDELFIDDEQFKKTYRKIVDGPSRTKYGIKIVSAVDGSYLPLEAYGLDGYVHPCFDTIDVGRYANGGSYHIYEMLFHIAAYLHGVPDAEDHLIHRLMIDLDYDGATHEYMHTIRGKGVKANQGWNAAIHAIWAEIMKRGRATSRFFDAADAKLESF